MAVHFTACPLTIFIHRLRDCGPRWQFISLPALSNFHSSTTWLRTAVAVHFTVRLVGRVFCNRSPKRQHIMIINHIRKLWLSIISVQSGIERAKNLVVITGNLIGPKKLKEIPNVFFDDFFLYPKKKLFVPYKRRFIRQISLWFRITCAQGIIRRRPEATHVSAATIAAQTLTLIWNVDPYLDVAWPLFGTCACHIWENRIPRLSVRLPLTNKNSKCPKRHRKLVTKQAPKLVCRVKSGVKLRTKTE